MDSTIVNSEPQESQLQNRRHSLRALAAAAGGLAVGMLAVPGEAQARVSLDDLQAQINALAAQLAVFDQRTGVVESNIMWSGGPTNYGTFAGLNVLTTEGTDFNSAGDYLLVNPNGVITFLRDGFYRVNLHTISRAVYDTDINVTFNLNGAAIHRSVTKAKQNSWVDLSGDVVWPCIVGDQLLIHINNPGAGVAYHAWAAGGSFTRLQVSFVGV